jgi:hypothetical protein
MSAQLQPHMKLNKYLLVTATLLPLAGLLLAAKPAQDLKTTRAARGKYLVTIIGCGDCHTPVK